MYGAVLWMIPLGCGRPRIFGPAANSLGSFYPRAIGALKRSPQETLGGPPLFDRRSFVNSGRFDVRHIGNVSLIPPLIGKVAALTRKPRTPQTAARTSFPIHPLANQGHRQG